MKKIGKIQKNYDKVEKNLKILKKKVRKNLKI